VIRNNAVFDNARVGGRGPGIILSSGRDNLAYNNLVWGNTIGIHLDYDSAGARLYNNVVYANRGYGVVVGEGSQGAVIENNIIYQNLGPDLDYSGSGTFQSHNLVGIDPKFVSPVTADFRLQLGSLAIDAGITVAQVSTDITGTSRPQNGAFDIGAYEFMGQ
jgi:parallel beta-helix repeat protein